jgi:hypothetical protein
MNHTGNGDSAAGKITSFYVTLLEAEVNPTTKVNATPKSKEEKLKSAKPKEIKSTQSAEERKSVETFTEQKKNNGPDLNINIQIHISSDASPDQIKSIFENMAKYVYKN